MNLNLGGKSVIVTGGGSNIGRAISLAFAKEGVHLTVAEIDEGQGQKVVAEAQGLGAASATLVPTDVTRWESVQAMVREVEGRAGRVDVLVNNVGWTYDRLFVEKERTEWEREIQLNRKIKHPNVARIHDFGTSGDYPYITMEYIPGVDLRTAIQREGRGKRAVTHWRRLQILRAAAMVECRLETGRTHQVRVHMASLGHPLLGDPVYGRSGKNSRELLKNLNFHRQALHAAELGFTHPVTKHRLSFASGMPADMQELFTALLV